MENKKKGKEDCSGIKILPWSPEGTLVGPDCLIDESD